MKKRSFTFCILVSFSLILLLINFALADKLDLQIKNSYLPGDNVNFKIILYDDSNKIIPGEINYKIENYYTDVIKEGNINSGDEINFIIPAETIQKPWKVSARYNDLEANRVFNIGKLENAEIKLENDELIIKNIGNVPYEKAIVIYIGETDQTANVRLEVGETKRIKLTAPEGVYTVKVNDGTTENDIIFNSVSLTGNVVSLQSVSIGGFWKTYPMVAIFLLVLIVLFMIVLSLRISNTLAKNKAKKRK